MRKGGLAHYAARHKPARNRDLFAFERREVVLDVGGVGGDVVLHLFVGVPALGCELGKFFPSDSRLFGEPFLLLLFGEGSANIFVHISSV